MIYQKPQLFMISLKVLLNNKQGETLLLKTPSKVSAWLGKYDLPGGRINDDEVDIDFHKLIDREIKEEVGRGVKYKLRQDPVSLIKFRFKDNRCIMYVLFEAHYVSGKIEISEEHTEFMWKKLTMRNIDKLLHYKFAAMMRNYWQWNRKIKVKF
jgi:ADP-ribose pyrophosphatase YjhB (NUDIX family)